MWDPKSAHKNLNWSYQCWFLGWPNLKHMAWIVNSSFTDAVVVLGRWRMSPFSYRLGQILMLSNTRTPRKFSVLFWIKLCNTKMILNLNDFNSSSYLFLSYISTNINLETPLTHFKDGSPDEGAPLLRKSQILLKRRQKHFQRTIFWSDFDLILSRNKNRQYLRKKRMC